MKNDFGTGKGADTITSGLEGAWTATPTKWSHDDFFKNLFEYEYSLTGEPRGREAMGGQGDAARHGARRPRRDEVA
ncbi:MAG: hypothetical protein R3B72_46220 [Polyangiaceae bacterium]